MENHSRDRPWLMMIAIEDEDDNEDGYGLCESSLNIIHVNRTH